MPALEQQHIEGLSARTHAAIRYAEDHGFWPNATAEALARYRRWLRPPGRYIDDGWGPDEDDAGEARDTLHEVMLALPPTPRRELKRHLQPLDEDFLRRSLPAQWWSPYAVGRWWFQRDRSR